MNFHRSAAAVLCRGVDSGRITLHRAMKLFRPAVRLQVRGAPPSTRFRQLSTVDYLIEATSRRSLSAWTSVLFPAELLRLFDIHPLTLEVMGSLFASLGLSKQFLDIADADDVPVTMCSFHRYLMGFARSRFLHRPAVVAATSLMCDGNTKSFAEAARVRNAPFLFLDVPYEGGPEGVAYVRDQLARMVEELAEVTGVPYDESRACAVVPRINGAIARMERMIELRRTTNLNLQRGHEVANFIFPFHFLLGSERLLDIQGAIIADAEAGRRSSFFPADRYGDDCLRLMWLHIVPQYKTPIWELIDDGRRARVVCDEYSSQPFEPYDERDLLGSIARRLCAHASNGPLARRIEHIARVARDFRCDGIVHYSSWGCHQAAGNVQLLGSALEAAGFPFLNINGDAVDERNSSAEQHKTRLEAFLESLESRRPS